MPALVGAAIMMFPPYVPMSIPLLRSAVFAAAERLSVFRIDAIVVVENSEQPPLRVRLNQIQPDGSMRRR